jgi:hypothetical protein
MPTSTGPTIAYVTGQEHPTYQIKSFVVFWTTPVYGVLSVFRLFKRRLHIGTGVNDSMILIVAVDASFDRGGLAGDVGSER